jgi:KDO2-lipid IV(A) lauroyltransferase
MSGISEEQILAQMSYSNYQQVEQQTRGRTWISAMSHYAMWEYVANYALLTDHRVVAVYHKLSSPVFERLMQQVRSRFGTLPVASGDIVRKIAQECSGNGKPMVIGMVADQVPPNYKLTQWYRFLGRDTKFFSGMGKCAVKYHLPVYFLDVDKVRPGYYVGTFEQIYSGDEPISADEITERYVRRLENMILRRPELWLWSHRRWKYDRTQIG